MREKKTIGKPAAIARGRTRQGEKSSKATKQSARFSGERREILTAEKGVTSE
jgi:hypothetical protein